ncbi:hypothetical protein M0804_010300 [Polistes exclamans]|nr:hypothetical protein M0804_010300 [Polistes exclamans]
MGRSVPDGWLEYKPYGEMIKGTKILPFKVPLKEKKPVILGLPVPNDRKIAASAEQVGGKRKQEGFEGGGCLLTGPSARLQISFRLGIGGQQQQQEQQPMHIAKEDEEGEANGREQNSTEQNRTEQSRTLRNGMKRYRTEQNRTEQNGTEWNGKMEEVCLGSRHKTHTMGPQLVGR